jgi:hypothetical protein
VNEAPNRLACMVAVERSRAVTSVASAADVSSRLPPAELQQRQGIAVLTAAGPHGVGWWESSD